MENDDEISFLDLLVFAAENWLSLVIIPLVAAVGAYVWTSAQPITYTATAKLDVPAVGSRSALSTIPAEFYRVVHAERDAATVAISGSTVSIRAAANSPDTAEEIVGQVYSEIAAPLIDAIADELDQTTSLIDQIYPIIRQIEANLGDDPENAILLLETQEALAPHVQLVSDATAKLETLRVPPTIDVARTGRSPSVHAIVAWAASGFILLVLLMLRQSFRSARSTDEGREKLARIVNALLLRRSR